MLRTQVALEFSPPARDETLSSLLIVPKSVSGRVPPLSVQHGGSMMTSAEERSAPDTVTVASWLQPRAVSSMYRANLLLPS